MLSLSTKPESSDWLLACVVTGAPIGIGIMAAIAQLAARRSHNPEVVSSSSLAQRKSLAKKGTPGFEPGTC